jgi:hypothetical protein
MSTPCTAAAHGAHTDRTAAHSSKGSADNNGKYRFCGCHALLRSAAPFCCREVFAELVPGGRGELVMQRRKHVRIALPEPPAIVPTCLP